MSEPTFCLVTTTINVPTLLEAYVKDALAHGRKLTEVIVAGDLKTHPDAAPLCARIASETGVPVTYLDPDDQTSFLAPWPALAEFLPWNSIQRRNVALLAAYQRGADIVVTIDDDNFLEEPDYFGGHLHLGARSEITAVSSSSGWWNVCELLEEERGIPFYHRGHPLSERYRGETTASGSVATRAVVNAGLWLGDPDVDAIARLCHPINATRRNPVFPNHVACAVGTWSPFNSQNTALLRETLPAYFLFPRVGRYDDVWGSYVVRHISDALGDVVTYGAPVVRQDRNAHSHFKDFDDERFGMQSTDAFIAALRACSITATDYLSAYRGIAEQFPEQIDRACAAAGLEPKNFDQVATGMRVWAETFAGI